MFNKRSVFFPFLALLVFVISVGCLCTGLTTDTPTAVPPPTQVPPTRVPPTQEPVQQPTTAPVVTEAPVTNTSGGWTTFTDQNDLYVIDVPSDWTYEHTNVSDEYAFYIDTFTSPDGGAVFENIVYDDGTAFVGSQNGAFALTLLNKFYSKTGREGDIRISETKEQKDGSTRMTWTSKEGKYSGVSYFEVRNKNTFMMLTLNWGNAVEEQYLDTVNAIIDSYRLP